MRCSGAKKAVQPYGCERGNPGREASLLPGCNENAFASRMIDVLRHPDRAAQIGAAGSRLASRAWIPRSHRTVGGFFFRGCIASFAAGVAPAGVAQITRVYVSSKLLLWIACG